jgi:hypothetical protein
MNFLLYSFIAESSATELAAPQWQTVVDIEFGSSGADLKTYTDREEFNKLAKDATYIRYKTNKIGTAVYKRRTSWGSLDQYELFVNMWSVKGENEFHKDFDIFSSYEDALADATPWEYCNGDDKGVGFPRDCGEKKHTIFRWFAFPKNAVSEDVDFIKRFDTNYLWKSRKCYENASFEILPAVVEAKASCPSGWEQVGELGADIGGCGITSCQARYESEVSTPAGCAERCAKTEACKAFSWAPVDGDKNHKGETVCSMYTGDKPQKLWKGVNGEYQQVFCKPSEPEVAVTTAAPETTSAPQPEAEVPSCPSGWEQLGEVGTDIAGCGLQRCNERYDLANAEECAKRCEAHKDCKSFNWAPLDGDKNHKGERVCTMYSHDKPNRMWEGINGVNQQVFCIPKEAEVAVTTAAPETTSAPESEAAGKWVKGSDGKTCDQVCSAEGLTCNSEGMDTLTTNELVAAAFKSVGHTCKSFHVARGYPGAPFSKNTARDDCAPLLKGSKSVCNGNKYGHHSALCWCEGEAAEVKEPEVGEVNDSNVFDFDPEDSSYDLEGVDIRGKYIKGDAKRACDNVCGDYGLICNTETKSEDSVVAKACTTVGQEQCWCEGELAFKREVVEVDVLTPEALDMGPSARFVGCFKDTRDRDLSKRMANFSFGEKDDRESCFAACHDAGYKYAGLQWHGQCFCDNDYGKYGAGDHCNCERGSKEFAYWGNCVYDMDAEASAPVTTAAPETTAKDVEVASEKAAAGKWVKGPNGKTCDQVCSAEGLTCKSEGMDKLTTNEAVAAAFLSVGHTCKSFHVARGYPGAPFSKNTARDDCAPLLKGSKSVCNGNKYGHHSALCWCEGQVAEEVEEKEPEPAFLGCFKDTKKRDLPARKSNFKAGNREQCFQQCSEAGFQYAGLQWTGECHCGNEYGQYGSADQCNCERGSKKFGYWQQCIYDLAATKALLV